MEKASGRREWRERGQSPERKPQRQPGPPCSLQRPKPPPGKNKINTQFKAIISFIQKINISLLSRHISNHIKQREETQSLWKL